MNIRGPKMFLSIMECWKRRYENIWNRHFAHQFSCLIILFLVKGLRKLNQAQYALQKIRTEQRKKDKKDTARPNLAEQTQRLERKLVIGSEDYNEHVKLIYKGPGGHPSTVLYADEHVDFIKSHSHTKSKQKVILQVVSWFISLHLTRPKMNALKFGLLMCVYSMEINSFLKKSQQSYASIRDGLVLVTLW